MIGHTALPRPHSSVRHSIVQEVYRPPLGRPRHRRDRIAPNVADLTLLSRPHLKAEVAIDAAKAVLANAGKLATRQYEQAAPAETNPLLSVIGDTGLQRIIGWLFFALVRQRSARLAHDEAGAELRQALLLQRHDRFAALRGPQPFLRSAP